MSAEVASLKLLVQIERKSSALPAYVTLPSTRVAAWGIRSTTTVEGSLGGVSLGRRSLKRLDSARWFVELPRASLEALGKSPGDCATLVLQRASADIPAELQRLIDTDSRARECWESRTEAQKRMLREDVLAAKSSAARERRARRGLLPQAKPPGPRIDGLSEQPRSIQVRIIGKRLPGRTCGLYAEVAVGLAQKTGCDPTDAIPADAREARWETRIELRGQSGAPRFRGPAVNGPPSERFLYLTWFGRHRGAAPAMFRRAKLRLDAVPAAVLVDSIRSGVLVGRLVLTAADGMPVCASIRPPEIQWASS
jgi:hypothetical protein